MCSSFIEFFIKHSILLYKAELFTFNAIYYFLDWIQSTLSKDYTADDIFNTEISEEVCQNISNILLHSNDDYLIGKNFQSSKWAYCDPSKFNFISTNCIYFSNFPYLITILFDNIFKIN